MRVDECVFGIRHDLSGFALLYPTYKIKLDRTVDYYLINPRPVSSSA